MLLGEKCQNALCYVDSFCNSDEFMSIPELMRVELQNGGLWNNLIDLEVLKAWCGKSNNKLGLILPNYRLIEHFGFYDISIAQVRKILNIKDFSRNDRRLLVFNASCNILMIIRVASEENLKDEISDCMNDVNLFCLLFADRLEGSGVVVTGIVVHSGRNPHLGYKCCNRQNMVVSREVFECVENFEEFWKYFEEQSIFRDIKRRLVDGDKQKVFNTISIKLLANMAQYQHEIGENTVFPAKTKDAVKTFTHKHFFLTPDQMEIAYSKEKRVILTGDYGSGKTIIAQKMLRLLAPKLRDQEIMYYINFNRIDGSVRKNLEKLNPNISVLKGSSTLSNTIKFEMLGKKEYNNAINVNLIVDEYNGESLTKNESHTLAKWFTKKKQFKDSKIFIAVKPMQIHRVHFHYAYGEESEYLEKGYMFGELEKVMTLKRLHNVMRNTVTINRFVEITKEYLNNKTNQYVRQFKSDYPLLKGHIERKTYSKRQKAKTKETFKETKKSKVLSLSPTVYYRIPNLRKHKDLNIQLIHSSKLLHTVEPQQLKLTDFDELYKLTNFKVSGNSENHQKISTTFRYHFDSNIGHNISGPLPKLVKLPSLVTSKELIELHAIVFKITQLETRRNVLIHFEPDNPFWLTSLLSLKKIFPSLSITEDAVEFLSRSSENLVLIVNYKYVRGMEFSNVMILLDADEYYLKQFIPEVISRCQRNLTIITKLPEYQIDDSDSAINLLGYLEEVNVERRIMKTVTLNFCNCASKQRCNLKACQGNGYCHVIGQSNTFKYYEVHRYCQLYRELSEEIQQKIVPFAKTDCEFERMEAVRL